jgi:hypothetical protein
MPWRRKPTSRLHYWTSGSPSTARADGFKSILVYCVGPPVGDPRPRCWHNARIPLDSLPEWPWQDICAHLKCTKCGSIGWIDQRPDWTEVINFNKGVC